MSQLSTEHEVGFHRKCGMKDEESTQAQFHALTDGKTILIGGKPKQKGPNPWPEVESSRGGPNP